MISEIPDKKPNCQTTLMTTAATLNFNIDNLIDKLQATVSNEFKYMLFENI